MGHQDDKEQIEAEAAEWVIRLGGEPLSQKERDAFQRWHSKSAYHAQTFDFAQNTWGDLAELRRAPGSLVADVARPSPKSELAIAGRVRAHPSRGRSWLGVGMAAMCLAIAIGGASFWYGDPFTMMVADYRTAPGEHYSVTLPDGSIVDLSSGSAIALHFTDKERRVELLEGAAYFTAAPRNGSETRPFVVEGAKGTATALGTQFAVERHSDVVEVLVVEHQVRVASIETDGQASDVILSPGQSVRYSPQTGMGEIHEKNAELIAAWRHGKLVFDQVPLADVVAELNRYRRGRIVFANSALANRKVSGVFDAKKLDQALDTITSELRISSASIPPLVTLLY